jgi:rubrerythrin
MERQHNNAVEEILKQHAEETKELKREKYDVQEKLDRANEALRRKAMGY